MKRIINHSQDPGIGRKTPAISNSLLLGLVLMAIFVVPIFPMSFHKLLYNLFYTGIFIAAALAMEKHRKAIMALAGATMVIEWLSFANRLMILTWFARSLNVIFFATIVVGLIIQIARKHRVTLRVIVASINGYLLLGIIFATIVTLVVSLEPAAFNFPERNPRFEEVAYYFSDYMYYTFVTFATLGYGDVVPQTPYAKSLAILISVTGQIYVAVIIAMLVGKYSAGGSDE